uniref:Putative ovule protein n=1 Tax=Solanum chacoense TaxID=4108 RepID=A0A0V0GPK3_SOLCH
MLTRVTVPKSEESEQLRLDFLLDLKVQRQQPHFKCHKNHILNVNVIPKNRFQKTQSTFLS